MRRACLSVPRSASLLGLFVLIGVGCSTGDGDGMLGGSVGQGGSIFVNQGGAGNDGTRVGNGSGAQPTIDISGSEAGATWVTAPKGVPQAIAAYQCTPKRFPHGTDCVGENFVTKTADNINWGEAMQKALWFFNVNKSGPGVFCADMQWRGDAHVGDAQIKLDPNDPNGVDMSQSYISAHRAALDPDGNGMLDVSGGFHDAGDYIKFGLTSAYAATMVAWSLHEFPRAYQHTGLEPEALALLRWFADYFMRSTYVEDGEVIAFAHQVGDMTDHSCGWMPPEVRLTSFCPRKAYFATHEKPATDVVATAAAALAVIGKDFFDRGVDIPYAEQCLLHAMALYRFAKQYPDAKYIADVSGGLYTGEYTADKLAWAAVWLAVATGDKAYLDDIVGSVKNWQDPAVWSKGWLSQFPGFASPNNGWYECWTYAWRSVRTAVFTKFADVLNQLTKGMASNRPEVMLAVKMKDIARDDAMGWVDTKYDPNDPTASNKSPGGFSMKFTDTWGSGRYNSAGQFLSLIYAKAFPDDPRAAEVRAWAKSQSEYLLGKNPLNKSYMMGFTDKYCLQPHHAAGHASVTGQPDDPPENRHVLWGALVNGPADIATDGHVDQRGDFGSNEVTIDYNGAFLAAIAANYDVGGSTQCPILDFPPIEPRIDEFYTKDKVNSLGDCFTQTEIELVNESIHPPRYDENLTVQYYIDVTELQAAGLDPSEIQASLIYDTGKDSGHPTTLKGPTPCEENGDIWYVELGYQGSKFWGEIAKLAAPRKVILQIGLPSQPGCPWKPGNDWSLKTLNDWTQTDAVTVKEPLKNPYVTVYSQGELIFGEEPPCHPVQKIIVPPPTQVLL